MGVVVSPVPIATMIFRYIVHTEFVTLPLRWLEKIEKQGGKFYFIFLAGFTCRR
jgi:hypothetical protein